MTAIESPGPIKNIADPVIFGVIGSLILPTIGYGSVAAVAGSLGLVASVCATGGAILLIPHMILYQIIDHSFDKHKEIKKDLFGDDVYDKDRNLVMVDVADRPIAHFCALLALHVGTVICAILIGAAIFGAIANPIGLCVLAGSITVALAGMALAALAGVIFGVAAVRVARTTKTNNPVEEDTQFENDGEGENGEHQSVFRSRGKY